MGIVNPLEAIMTGERSAHRDIDLPENFDEWPDEARVQYLRSTMTRDDILRAIVETAECDDREVTQALSKDQATEVYIALSGL